VISYTAPTSAIRLRFAFSPRESLVLSFGEASCAALAVAGLSASGRILIPLPSADSTNTSSFSSVSLDDRALVA
jgi:hypothetical protein